MPDKPRSFVARVGALKPSTVFGISIAWVVLWLVWPWAYFWLSGRGWYFALSFREVVQSVLILLGPLLVFVVLWWRARRSASESGGAV